MDQKIAQVQKESGSVAAIEKEVAYLLVNRKTMAACERTGPKYERYEQNLVQAASNARHEAPQSQNCFGSPFSA